MTDYDTLSKFYDAFMGDRSVKARRIGTMIRTAHPSAKSILELGCGTGAVLKHLRKHYTVSGLDLSRGMLATARKTVSDATFYQQSMVGFSVPESFDVILCVFDSMNHILAFRDWTKVFAATKRHLNDGGVFILDINIEKRIGHLPRSAWAHWFGNDCIVVSMRDVRKHVYQWDMRVFEHRGRGMFRLHEMHIRESSFPLAQVRAALRRHFRSVDVIDANRKDPLRESDRFYLVCSQ